MSALLNEPALVSQSVESLKHALAGDQSSIDWLVISHDDPEIDKRITGVTGKGTSTRLLIPQSDWDFQSEEMSAVLDWSINQAGAKHVLLVGHSAGCDSNASDAASNDQGVAESGSTSPSTSRLFGGTRQILVQAQQAKLAFADKVDTVLNHQSVQGSINSGALRLHAIFYLAYSQAFLIYNPATRTFLPLGPHH